MEWWWLVFCAVTKDKPTSSSNCGTCKEDDSGSAANKFHEVMIHDIIFYRSCLPGDGEQVAGSSHVHHACVSVLLRM